MEIKKPHISASQLSTYWSCGYSWYLRYVEKKKYSPATHLVFGSVLDKIANKILIKKAQTGLILSYDQVEPHIEKIWQQQINNRGIRFSYAEQEEGVEKVTEKLIAALHLCTKIYISEVALKIIPLTEYDVQREVRLEIEGYKYDILLYYDVIEELGFRDLKTSKKKPSQQALNAKEQYTIYSLAFEKEKGFEPIIWEDTIIKNKTPRCESLKTKRSITDYQCLINRMENFADGVDKGVFTPASQSDFKCGPNTCEFAKECRYYYGWHQFALGGI